MAPGAPTDDMYGSLDEHDLHTQGALDHRLHKVRGRSPGGRIGRLWACRIAGAGCLIRSWCKGARGRSLACVGGVS